MTDLSFAEIERQLKARGMFMSIRAECELKRGRSYWTWVAVITCGNAVKARVRAKTIDEARRRAYDKLMDKEK